MLLKKIEFQGFKSFVDPTALDFETGISGIIGPNGCGKSNVSDAIRWVLGEQSAKALRGAKMVDVIFNGTEGRKPSGLAEVTLTISNEDRALPVDFAEVSVTRRSYRSGETEYFINKVPSRLRDIFALFSDTGIGTDGYSLLEQGKMDLILSSKPMERRSVFEEAAGITRYKTQRDEALRKLEATEQNLLRVNDIVQEVRRQIGSLERQARRAEKYQVLKSELDTLQSRFLIKEHRVAREKQDQLHGQLSVLREELEGLEASLRERDAKLSHLRVALLKDEEALSGATARVHALETELAQVDRQIELNRQQCANLDERAERATAEAAQLRSREAELRVEMDQARAARDQEIAQLDTIRGELAEAEGRLRGTADGRRKHNEQAQDLQQKSLDLINRRSTLRAEQETLHGKSTMVNGRMDELRQELRSSQELLHQASVKLEEAFQQADTKGQQARSLEEELGGRQARRRELEEAVRAAEESLSSAQVVLGSDKARLTVLEELAKALEGYEAGPKALLLAAQKKDGSVGMLEGLAHRVRTKTDYELAVELALGHRLQTLLAPDASVGQAALAWLKENKLGRASFLTKDDLRPSPADWSQELLGQEGVIGALADVVESDEELRPAVQWLAGRHLLVRDLATATRVRGLLPVASYAVSLDGNLVSCEGVVSGGSTDTSERGLLGREREMDELRAQIQRGEEQRAARAADRDRLRQELSSLAEEINKRSADLQGVQIEVAQLRKEQSGRQADHVRLTQESEDKRKNIEASEVEAAGYRARLEGVDRQLAEIAGQEAEMQGRLNAVLDAIDKLRKEEEEAQATVSARRVTLATGEQRLQNLAASANRLESELAQVAQQAGRRESEQKQSQEESASLRARNGELENALKELFARKDQAIEEQKTRGEARSERMAEIQATDDGMRETRVTMNSRAEERHGREMQLQELKLKTQQLELTLTQDYKLDLENLAQKALQLPSEGTEGSTPAAEEEVDPARLEDLKKKLDELGVVNPAAAEEYRELEQRHSLLVGQLEDLKTAKSDLMKVIHKINQESRERFIKTFDQVHENFRRIYRTLFGGGEAKLVLAEDGDMLEAGIDIIARPPGKRQQSISLLSGGEKALTAIALLFALFECKPSPFCVLDEIDAPLDDANIGRFTALLSEYAKKTQFIVITHSKLTMERANILYGVTMEEAGVSKIISAKFKDDKPVVAG